MQALIHILLRVLIVLSAAVVDPRLAVPRQFQLHLPVIPPLYLHVLLALHPLVLAFQFCLELIDCGQIGGRQLALTVVCVLGLQLLLVF